MARIGISGKCSIEMETDESSEDEVFMGPLKKKEVMKLHIAGRKAPTFVRHPVIASPAVKHSGVELISDNELSQEVSSNSLVYQSDSKTQQLVTGRLEQSVEEDKRKKSFYENLTKNCNITERSVVGGRHASLQAENVDTKPTEINGNIEINMYSMMCDEKLMSTDRSDGDSQMSVAAFENGTVDVQSANSLQEDVSESVELISDDELSQEIPSKVSVHQSATQSQEFVPGSVEQSLEEYESNNSLCENIVKNCNVTERSFLGGRRLSLQGADVDIETMRANGIWYTNTSGILCDEKLMSTDKSDGDNQISVAMLENATVDEQPDNCLHADVSESVALISDNALSQEVSSNSVVFQSDSKTQQLVTGKLEQSVEEDKRKNSFYENLTKNCNVTERSVVGGRHASLQAENVDTKPTEINGNTDRNMCSMMCDEKLMSTDRSDGDSQMSGAAFVNGTVDVQSANSLQEDVSESVELISDDELSQEISSKVSVHQSGTQSQELVPGSVKQSLEEDESNNSLCENMVKNCNVTERSFLGGRCLSLQGEEVDIETMRANGIRYTDTSSILCDEKLMSTDKSDGDNQISVAMLENATVDEQPDNCLQVDVSESVALISDNELSQEVSSNSVVFQSDSKTQQLVTGKLEQSVEEDKRKNSFYENLTKNCNVTERSVVGGRHASLQAENVDTKPTEINGNTDRNMCSMMCDEKLMSTDRSDGDSQMSGAAFVNGTVDVQSANSLQEDVSESVELISDDELSQEIPSKVSVHQSGTQSQELVPGSVKQSLEEDESNNSLCENMVKNCNVTERSFLGGRCLSLQGEEVDIETMRANGIRYTNTSSILCDEKLMSTDKSDGDNQISVAMLENATVDEQPDNCLQVDVSESVALISDNALSQEVSSNSLVYQADSKRQQLVTGNLEQSVEEDKRKNSFYENLTKNCNITERSVVGGRHASLQAENIDTKPTEINGDTDINMYSMMCDEKLMSTDRSDGDSQMSRAAFVNGTVDVQSANSLQEDVSERPEVINNVELLPEASLVCGRHTLLPTGTVDITTKKTDGSSTTGVKGVLRHQVITSTDGADTLNQITADVCENLPVNLQSQASPQINALGSDCGNGSIDSECMFQAEVSAIVKDLNDFEKFEAIYCEKETFSSSTSETYVLETKTSSVIPGTTDSLMEDSFSSDEDILENTFEMMEKLLNGFQMKPDCACEGEINRTHVNEVDISHTHKTEESHTCEVEAGTEPAYTHTHNVEPDCVCNCERNPADCVHALESEPPDCVPSPESQPADCVPGPQSEPADCVRDPESEPADCVRSPESESIDCVCGPESESIDCVRGPESESIDCVRGPESESIDCVRGPESESIDCVRGPESESIDCVCAPVAEPANCVRTPVAEPANCVRTPVAEPANCVCTPVAEPANCVRTPVAEPANCVRTPVAEPANCVRTPVAEPANCVRTPVAEPANCVRTPVAEPANCVRTPVAEPANCVRTPVAEPANCVRPAVAEPANCVRPAVAEPANCVRPAVAEPANCVRPAVAEPANCVRPAVAEPANCVRPAVAEPANCVRPAVAEPANCVRTAVAEPANCVRTAVAEPANCVRTAVAEPANCVRTAVAEPANCVRTPVAEELNCLCAHEEIQSCTPVIVVTPIHPLEPKLNPADNLDIKLEVEALKNIERESNCGRFTFGRDSGNVLYHARCNKTPKTEGSTHKMLKNQILPQSAGSLRKGRLQSVKSCVKEYLNSTQPPLFSNVRNRNGYGMKQKVLLSSNTKKVSQDCSTPCRSKKTVLPPVSYTSSSAAKLDVIKSTSANYVAEKCKKKIVPRSSPTVIKHAGRTILSAKQWKQNAESEGEVSVLLASEASRSHTLKRTRKKE